jgi:hypothetical protein
MDYDLLFVFFELWEFGERFVGPSAWVFYDGPTFTVPCCSRCVRDVIILDENYYILQVLLR